MSRLLYRLGRATVRRRRLVVLAWIIAAVGVIALGSLSGGKTSDAFEAPGVESQTALDVLQRDFPAAAGTSAQLVFATDTGTLSDPAAAAAVNAALADVARQPHVDSVGTLQRAPDGRVAYADVQYDVPSDEIRTAAFNRLEDTAAEVKRSDVVRMELGGDLPSEAVQPEFGGQEFVGLIVAAIVLLFAFGSIIAMGLPIGIALVGLATSVGLITIIASFVDVSSVSPTIATMIGLGVGIDYALFIVTRHRENLQLGLTVEDAAGRALATAGSAVLFAGITVMIAICGLAIAGIPLVTVMGLTAGLTVAVMVAVALTLLPALLGFAGHKIDSVRLPFMRRRAAAAATRPARESMWHRWGRQVSAHPWRYLAAGVIVARVADGAGVQPAPGHDRQRLDAGVDHHPPRLRPARRRVRTRLQRPAAAFGRVERRVGRVARRARARGRGRPRCRGRRARAGQRRTAPPRCCASSRARHPRTKPPRR